MKTISTKIFILIVLLIFVGCDKNFEEVNDKSYAPKDVNPGTLLPTAIKSTVDRLIRISYNHNNELMQYTSMNNTVDELHWYSINTGHSATVWNLYNSLQDVVDIISISEENGYNNYKAIGLTWKSLIYAYLTDVFVEVPYSEGVKGEEGIFLPSFDAQKDVYLGILADLEEANDIIDVEQGLNFGGDILYNGNMLKWKKFVNSLRIRYYVRLSKRDEINAGANISTILNNPSQNPVFEGNDDAALLNYTGVQPFVNPFSTDGPLTFELHNMCTTLMDLLKATDDPRLPIYAEPTEASKANGEDPVYEGTPSGLPFSEITGTDFTKSLVNFRFKAADQPAIIMPYYELEFLLAEAALKGLIEADAATHYQNGIISSMNYWNVEVPADFFEHPEVEYNNTLEQIIEQKWVALFFTGMESWFDHRRTGFPILRVGEGHRNDGQLPVRYTYPTSVQALNLENYETAVSRLGGDNLNIKGWWEKD